VITNSYLVGSTTGRLEGLVPTLSVMLPRAASTDGRAQETAGRAALSRQHHLSHPRPIASTAPTMTAPWDGANRSGDDALGPLSLPDRVNFAKHRRIPVA